ncbi:hypothetical protein GE21DRAFT_1096004 [Neurospora crassa]|nr:hypothetical protein GE21DRAFT_1096004 [Neurospora crassa]
MEGVDNIGLHVWIPPFYFLLFHLQVSLLPCWLGWFYLAALGLEFFGSSFLLGYGDKPLLFVEGSCWLPFFCFCSVLALCCWTTLYHYISFPNRTHGRYDDCSALGQSSA